MKIRSIFVTSEKEIKEEDENESFVRGKNIFSFSDGSNVQKL